MSAQQTIAMMTTEEAQRGWTRRMDRPAEPVPYQIRVRGHLGETLLGAFPGLRAQADGADTVLIGVLRDQASLFGVLAEIEAVGLELLELRRMDH
jgi:hypothetical protein